MTRIEWKADAELRDTVLKSLSEYNNSQKDESDATTADILELLGTLVFAGCEEDARQWLEESAPDDFSQMTEPCLEEIEGGGVDNAAIVLSSLIPTLRESSLEDRSDIEEQVVDALRARDQIELVLAGAELVLGDKVNVNDELGSSIDAFDDLITSMLWMTVALGQRRAARCAWASPEYRHKLWWWHRGCDFPHNAIESLETTAQLIHVFPQAQEELDLLLKTEQTIQSLSSPDDEKTNVFSISDWIHSVGESKELAVAAGDRGGHRTLLKNDKISFSTNAGKLVIDCEVKWDDSAKNVATIKVSGLEDLPGTETLRGRYEFDLDSGHMKAASATLVVRLRDEVLQIPLPPVED